MPSPGRLVAVAVLAVACHRNPPPPPPPAPPVVAAAPSDAGVADAAAELAYRTDSTTFNVTKTPSAVGATFMVVSESIQATKVGHDVLANGGNAVDAIVATAFALAVVHPTAGNLGGGGFAVVRPGPGQATALDFRETAPAAASADMFLDASGKPTDASLVGDRAVGVPGSVAGLYALHHKYGKQPWATLLEPAITLARDGFNVDPFLTTGIEVNAVKLMKFPATMALWLPGRIPRRAGDHVTNPELAVVLERIASKGADGFYKGETATAIVDEMKANGGLVTAHDLASYEPVWREPLRFAYRDYSIISMPPPSSGGIVLGMVAGILRGTDVGKLPWHGTDHIHLLVESWRRAFAARNGLLGDPAFVADLPVAELLSQAYTDKLAASIGPRATPSADIPAVVEGDHTTNICVVDASGMAVAMTTTLNTAFGSGVTVAGFLLNDEMDDFTSKLGSANTYGLRQGAANKIEPGKRMLSSMSPAIVENKAGEVVLLAGAGGGPRIITAVWQTISNWIDFHQTIDVAVTAPRIHHQHLPDEVRVEALALDKPTTAALTELGYPLDWSEPPRAFADVTAIARRGSAWDGAADPRGGGAAMGD